MNCLRLALLCLFSVFFGKNTQAQPQEVRTGIYLLNLYDLNMDEHSFYADFYVWLKWKGDIDPTNIEFVNAVEKWGMTKEGEDSEVSTLSDGYQYKIMRVEGRFFHSFALERFPLDYHSLSIEIENPDFPKDSLVYIPDTTGIRPTMNLVGWEVKGCQLTNGIHDYQSNFGNPDEPSTVFSNLRFSLLLSRPVSYFFLKMMMPLLVVILVSLGALLLNPQYIDPRSQLPIGSLLTAVFLQQSYSSALPDTGYMVLMDKIYLLAYLIISLVLLQVILVGNLSVKGDQARIARWDKREQWIALIVLFLFLSGVFFLIKR